VALALEPRPATLAEHPTIDRLVGSFAEHLDLLGEDMLAQPAGTEARGNRRQRPSGEAMPLPQISEQVGPFWVRLAGDRAGPRHGLRPAGVGPHRRRPVQRGPQTGVVQQPTALDPATHRPGLG
jgi:hypothetical protein